MALISTDSFITMLRNCGVVDQAVVDKVEESATTTPVKKLAKKLVEDQVLTPWQAKFLLSGRHQLRIGSYILLKRIERDRLGDRFEAIHEQLDRKVDLQILPGDLSNQDEILAGFLKQARDAANLDHPNIIHVYDIDQEKGRYFLVVEHLDGKSLDSIDDIQFEPFCKIIQQTLHGLNYAHSKNVVHGSVSPTNIVVIEDGQSKISNIAISTLVRSLDAEQDDTMRIAHQPEDDLRDLGTFASRYLRDRFASTTDLSRNKLTAVINQLVSAKSAATESETITANLDAWISNRFPSETKPRQELSNAIGQGPSPATTDPNGPPDVVRHPLQLPIMISAIACTVIITGFIGYFGYKLIAGDSKQNRVKFNKVVEELPDSNIKMSESQDKEEKKDSDLPDSNIGKEDPERIAITDSDNDSTDNETKTTEKLTPDKSADVPNETEQSPPKDTIVTPVVATANKQPDAAIDAEPKESEKNTVGDGPDQPKGDPSKPFEHFLDSVELPELTRESADLQPRKLGSILLGDSLLGVNLISPSSILKQKFEYGLKRSVADDQRWEVTVKKPRSDKVKIAEFWLKDAEFMFLWSDAAKGDLAEGANLFRNSLIKLETATESTHVALRSPIQIESPLLNEKNAESKIEFEIPFIPKTELLSVVIDEIKHDSKDDQFSFIYYPETRLVGDRKKPLRICFTTKETAMFTRLQIESRLSSRSSYVSWELQIATPYNPKPRTYRPKYYETFELNTVNTRNQLSAKYNLMVNTVAPDGQKTEFAKRTKHTKERLDAANLQVDEVRLQKKNLENIMNKRIGGRIYVTLEGHEIVLVQFQAPTDDVQEKPELATSN